MGFNVENVKYENINFQVWDLGGQTEIRYIISIINYLSIGRTGDAIIKIRIVLFL